jgi:hypothetical protein
MGASKFFLFFIAMLFLNNIYARPGYYLNTALDKNKSKIGGLISMSVKIGGPNIQNVSWDLANKLLAENPRIKIIYSKIVTNGPGRFQNDFIFTSVKPGNVVLSKMPVSIKSTNGYVTLFTKEYRVNFVGETLPSNISDIKTINQTWLFSNRRLLVLFIAFSIAAGAIGLVLLGLKLIKKRTVSVEKIRSIYLHKIQVLQEQITNDQKKDEQIKEQIFSVFNEYLAKTFEHKTPNNPTGENLDKILDHSDKVRFSYGYRPLALKIYADEIKAFIKAHPVSLS